MTRIGIKLLYTETNGAVVELAPEKKKTLYRDEWSRRRAGSREKKSYFKTLEKFRDRKLALAQLI